MSLIIIPLVYGAILFLDAHLTFIPNTQLHERIIYRILTLLAILISFPTAIALQLDHVGASLSGIVSIFTR